MKKLLIILAVANPISFVGGYLLSKRKNKVKYSGTLHIDVDTDPEGVYLELDKEISEIKNKRYINLKVNKLRS